MGFVPKEIAPLVMTDSAQPVDPDSLPDTASVAAYWFARERSGRMTAEQRMRRDAWLRASADHVLEYERARGIWNAARLVPAERLQALMNETPKESRARSYASSDSSSSIYSDRSRSIRPGFSRRRFAFGFGLACTAAAAVGISVYVNPSQPSYSLQVASAVGQYRQVTLPDDSIIELNTGTRLSVNYYPDRREVILQEGEAAFTVSPDAERPFFVEAGDTSVRVTGTRFGVRRQAQAASIAVLSGAVQVRQGPWWSREQADLRAGQTLAPGTGNHFTVLSAQDTDSVLAWRQGRVVFRDTPLASAVNEINRYASQPIRLNIANANSIRIAGTYSTRNINGFLELLPDIAPVAVQRLANGSAVIVRK